MEKQTIIALEDMQADLNTWTKGLDYELWDKGTFFTITSNQAQISFSNSLKDEVLGNFKRA